MSTVTAASGQIAPVCQDCGKRGKYAPPTSGGLVDLWEIASGWSVAPYSEDYEHPDGSRGSQYRCPSCHVTTKGAQR